jgi:redox-sensitive bicupin YhaK (pirin superfamily)
MSKVRGIKRISKSRMTMEGAGVRLKRAFGYTEVPDLDPFLLLDDFHSDNPDDYMAGFPWHPHRGIETVTYMLHGQVEHGDSMGNKGVIETGDCQWMTAGCGIIHQEMPKSAKQLLWGFQLWVNLPAKHKMMEARYQEVKLSEIPEVNVGNDVKVKVICGEVEGIKGPVRDIVAEPEYLDVNMPPDVEFEREFKTDHKVFAYTIEGSGKFHPDSEAVEKEHLIIYEEGETVKISSGKDGLRYLLVSGKPIGEPVAWYGPIVMNTQAELDIAFKEYREGTFIKK